MQTVTPPFAASTAAHVLSIPRKAPADSFVLHAPLELMARAGLSAYVEPEQRPAAERQIAHLAHRFVAAGPAVLPPPATEFDSLADGAAALGGAIASGDLDAVDATATWLLSWATPAELPCLIGAHIVDSLAAAAHAPIGLALLRRVAGGTLRPTLLRGALRELARQPDWRITWFRSPTARRASGQPALAEALRRVPLLGSPGSNFIKPLMSQVEDTGVCADVLAPALGNGESLACQSQAIMRAAAWSMLHDAPSEAPYGWTHCLTLPQAVLALAGNGVEERTAIAVAATFVAGFRAGLGAVELGELGDDDAVAAGGRSGIDVVHLATNAALHEDAHLVKYTLACIHAAHDDPAWSDVYLAGAAYLAAWWTDHSSRLEDAPPTAARRAAVSPAGGRRTIQRA